MTSITIGTGDLLRLLNVLQQTAIADEDGNGSPWCGILLHCARNPDAPPGQREVLAGTAGDGWVLGHTSVRCQGQWTRPTLWSIDDVKAVIDSFKPKLKSNKQHVVELELSGGGQVTVAEAENDLLTASGLRVLFTEKSLSEYPRNAWQLLTDVPVDPKPIDRVTGLVLDPQPRTDVAGATLGAFSRVAKILGSPVEIYRYHQRVPWLIQIGGVYRGFATTAVYDEVRDAARWPHAIVHDPDLPPKPPRDPAAGGVAIVRDGQPDAGFVKDVIDTVTGVVDEVLTEFPAVARDPEPLCEAATIVVEAQFAGASYLQKTMRIGFARASALLEQLETYDVVGPKQGSRSRRVLVAPPDLPAALAAIRGPENPAPATEASTE